MACADSTHSKCSAEYESAERWYRVETQGSKGSRCREGRGTASKGST